jgi:serine O-acetyltransferase
MPNEQDMIWQPDDRETSRRPPAEAPDWSRERCTRFWDPGRRVLKAIRSYQHWRERGGVLGRFVSRVRAVQHLMWSTIAGCDIPLTTCISGGLLLPHPNGIVIHPDVVIGPNCLLFQQVTLGTNAGSNRVPILGTHVDVGAGARILGGVTIGDHARIGANAVVLTDVPDGATAVGVPARIILRSTEGSTIAPEIRRNALPSSLSAVK